MKRYLSVIQHFSLGGVGFKAQDSFSFVKLIFNSPRIHLFMATCGRGGIDPDPLNSLTLSFPNSFRWGVSHQAGLHRDGAVVGEPELPSQASRKVNNRVQLQATCKDYFPLRYGSIAVLCSLNGAPLVSFSVMLGSATSSSANSSNALLGSFFFFLMQEFLQPWRQREKRNWISWNDLSQTPYS